MMLEVLLFGYLMTFVCGEGGVDVVLSCSLVQEGAGLDGMRAGFTRTPATLVLRDVRVPPDQLPDTLTPFIPPTLPDPEALLFEAKVSSPEIPDGDLLVHADCNDQEVMCEISRYFPHGGSQEDGGGPAYFISSLHIEGGGLSTTLLLQTLAVEKDQPEVPPLMHTRLGLPLSQSGSLLTEVVFLVFSGTKSVSGPLGGDVLLNCGFRQQEESPVQDVAVEWWLQHRGNGRRVLEITTGSPDTETRTQMQVERKGASVDAHLLVKSGNASVTLRKLRVMDEGAYICTVTVGVFHAQQVVQLQVIQPPHVSLSEEKLVFQAELPQKLSCHCNNYYPLDAQVEWFSLSPADKEPSVLADQGSLSSHRQHGDGTMSLSSHITLPPGSFPPGTTVICRVSHPALETPLSLSLTVERPEPDSYWMFMGFLFVTGLFFYQLVSSVGLYYYGE